MTKTYPERFHEVIQLAKEGLSSRQIGDRIGMNHSAALYRMHIAAREGLIDPPERKNRVPIEALVRLVGEGRSNGEIAAEFGVERGTVARWKHDARRRGILPRFVPSNKYETAQTEMRRKLRARLGTMAMVLNGMTDDQMRWALRLVPEGGTFADVIRGMVIDAYYEETGNSG